MSLSNWTFCNLTLEENIRKVKDLGFANIEFNSKCIQFEVEGSLRSAATLINSYNLKCLSAHCASFYVENLDQVRRAIYYGELSIDMAAELSSPILVIHSYISKNLNAEYRAIAVEKIFPKLLDYAENRNVKLALENLSFYSQGFGKNISEIEELLKRTGFKHIGVTLDFCHSENINQTFNFLRMFETEIKNIHISGPGHTAIREDSLTLKLFLQKLKSIQYDGPLTIEISPKYGTQEIRETKKAVEQMLKL